MSDDEELAALREQTAHGDRLDEAGTTEDEQVLVEAIQAELAAIDRGDQQKTISVWDGTLAAFIRALEEHPDQLTAVGHALQDSLDIDEASVDRSEVLRLALRLGFQTAAPSTYAAVRAAVKEHATKDL